MRHASAGSQSAASAASSSERTDTIAAIATAAGPAGLGVVRLSGPQSIAIARRLGGIEPKPRHAHYVRFRDAEGEVIDDGLLIAFVAPASYTGEDVVELQAHGSPALLRLLLARCVELGARQARPGEFTERAFLNERLDLAQAEAVADLIHASSEAAARAARRALDGEFSRRVDALTEALIALRIYVEAAIDFPEEEIDFLAGPELKSRLQQVRELMQALLREARRGQRLRDGLHVVIAGPPNAGKSSLLNALAGSERAIVTDIAGTTRDLLRESVLIDGIELTLVDTAGLREGADVVEAEGMRRARAEFQRADLALAVVECGSEQAQVPALREELAALPQVFWLHNKCELAAEPARRQTHDDGEHFWLSAREGIGLDALRDALKQTAGLGEAAEGAVSARARHVEALQRAHTQLESAAERLAEGSGELAAEDLRAAQEALGAITGRVSADDLLGRIFGSFCIGK
ncbi:tRNA uridine-5-carboxymethylaminomethyl(34) synthesis GTPase MnmE [Aquimonas voraii]|uniref:tRNA modification GTPase MnmE n=1 Tax=Aquimonas voraii TaxID=265719 RepID=A0A1G6WKU3_9GAMM|nr:tRNA uridine-5-carboxymethylaminomethyl(34) synthesis GTPase MnmE [Aquimonas voraii]SDD65675.1 tRNA modification GTPase trmE [Aquimonas voraii]